MTSELLINEPPLLVYPTLAEALGINTAVIFQQLHFLLNITEKAKNKYNFVNNQWWVYNSYESWRTDHFRWISEGTIKGSFLYLESCGIVLTMQSVKNPSDRKKWYTIDYVRWESCERTIRQKLSDGSWDKNCLMVRQKLSDGYSETTTETTEESAPNGTPASKQSEKSKTKTYADRAAAGKQAKSDPIVRALAIHLFKAADNPVSITTKEGRIKRLLFGYAEAGWIGLFEYEKQFCPDTSLLYNHIIALIPGYVEFSLEGCSEIVVSQDIFGDWWDRYRQTSTPQGDPLDSEIDDPERPGVRITRRQLQSRLAQRRLYEQSTS